MQYRDTPLMMEWLRKLGKESGLGPSGAIAVLLRRFIEIPHARLAARGRSRTPSQERDFAYLTGLIHGLNLKIHNADRAGATPRDAGDE